MRAILVLNMVSPAAHGGLGFDTKRAASIYDTYDVRLPNRAAGGLIARNAVFVAGTIIACGHFSRLPFDACFYAGLVLIRLVPASSSQHPRARVKRTEDAAKVAR